jgi:hypothetical protein
MNRVHALKFTATGGPDGILQNLGVVAGRRHDRIGLRNSRINTKLENAQNNRGVPALQQGITYVDKGFDNLSHVLIIIIMIITLAISRCMVASSLIEVHHSISISISY